MKCNWSAFADFLYPREGTKYIAVLSKCCFSKDFLYPREGTKYKFYMRRDYGEMIFFIPARGRNCKMVDKNSLVLRFSLSPRGDEIIRRVVTYIQIVDFLYPREGTKLASISS